MVSGFQNSNLIVKKFAEISVVTVATPTSLEQRGNPKHPSELDQHYGVIFLQQGTPR
jgi:hypothetical protein